MLFFIADLGQYDNGMAELLVLLLYQVQHRPACLLESCRAQNANTSKREEQPEVGLVQ